MSRIIIHKDGVFNAYSTISDGPTFMSGITEVQLRTFMLTEEHGYGAIANITAAIARAKERGTSSRTVESLEELLLCNRAGPNETTMSYEQFVQAFLKVR